MIYKLVVGALLSSLLLVSSTSTGQAEDPQEKVRKTVNAVLAVLQDKSLEGPDNAHRRLEKIRQAVVQRFGLEEMAKRSLGEHWQQRTKAEKQEFVELFGELLERSYANRLTNYTGEQTVRYTGQTIDQNGYASVGTEIVSKRDHRPQMEYRLLLRDGNWQVYDVVIEGISLVDNYRTQFNNIVSQKSYEALLKMLKLKREQERSASPVKD
jgi:phospholipid transport system substrate-binding protein